MDIIDTNGIVMIVDDTPGNLALLSDTLSEAGYRVLVATDGLAALEQINYLTPDIILMDVLMPGIDGFETCRRLKENPETADIPVLFMTGLSELDNLLRGFSEGGLDYIIKPIRPPEVLARIDVHLGLARKLFKKETQEWDSTALKESLGLTLREIEILMWISRGKTNKEVGLILESSHRTVNKHLEHIFEKLGVTTRAAAVAIVLQKAGTTS